MKLLKIRAGRSFGEAQGNLFMRRAMISCKKVVESLNFLCYKLHGAIQSSNETLTKLTSPFQPPCFDYPQSIDPVDSFESIST